MKQKGSANEMTSKVVMLQEENERLKNMVLDKNQIQQQIRQNEDQLKIELEQKGKSRLILNQDIGYSNLDGQNRNQDYWQ